MDELLLGVHIRAEGGIYQNLKLSFDTGMKTAQIFISNPKTGVLTKTFLDHKECKNIAELAKDHPIIVHGAYTNSPKSLHPKKNSRNYKSVMTQIHICKELGFYGFLMHFPKITIQDIAENLCYLKIPKGVKLLLETPAVKPDQFSFETPEKINNACHILNETKIDYGICIDTAHIVASGYSLKTYEEAEKFFDEIKYPDKIAAIHFNGLLRIINGYHDVHACALSDLDIIWGKMNPLKTGACIVVKFAAKYKIPIIMELVDAHMKDLEQSIEKIRIILEK